MSASILLLATCYDGGSFCTFAWARKLQEDLMRQGDTCLMFDAGILCRAGTSLDDAIDRVDFVVFYGHGSADEWTALPASPLSGMTTPLMDTANVHIIKGRKAYGGCCESLSGLGMAYAGQFPNGAFIGYRGQFGFEVENHEYFRDVVNHSVVAFVKGDPASKVTADLRTEWENLRDAFAHGNLKHRPNAIMASQRADENRQRVGHLP